MYSLLNLYHIICMYRFSEMTIWPLDNQLMYPLLGKTVSSDFIIPYLLLVICVGMSQHYFPPNNFDLSIVIILVQFLFGQSYW